MDSNTLARYAKAITAVVEAGGPRYPDHIAIVDGEFFLKPSPFESYHKGGGKRVVDTIIAVLEKYVREDVVVWFYTLLPDGVVRSPWFEPVIGKWKWQVDRYIFGPDLLEGSDPCPIEAHIAFLEAIAEVVAGEKGDGVIEHADLKRELLGGDNA